MLDSVHPGASVIVTSSSKKVNMNGVDYITGTGFPNGVVTAPVGSIYIDTAVTNGASSWIKKSGTGNTGWQVLDGDTGWRDITSQLGTFWTPATGQLAIMRNKDTVTVRISGITAGASATGIRGSLKSLTNNLWPTGFGLGVWTGGSAVLSSITVFSYGGKVSNMSGASDLGVAGLSGIPGNWTPGDGVHGFIQYPTPTAYPTSLPGIATT